MKGVLKGSDGTVFNLLPKVTTIGRHDCSLTIQSSSVDSQHAVIEYNGQKDCFVLQDLDTSSGTSVNRCLVRNAAVCLQPGNVLKFGDHPVIYEFVTTNESPHARPPSYPRPAWTSSSTNFTESTSLLCGPSHGLSKSRSLQRLNVTTGNYSKPNISPHPPMSAKTRSVENGVRRNSLDLTLHTAPNQDSNDSDLRLPQTPDGKNGSHIEQLQKHLKILTEELKLLAGVEMNSHQKDALINQLNGEIAVLQSRLLHNESGSTIDLSEVKQKLTHLEKEMVREKMETKSLKSQLSQMKPVVSVTTSPYHAKCANSAAISTLVSKGQQKTKTKPQASVFVESESADAKALITEIEYLRKDKNITLGLLTQIQKEMANKDVNICHLTKQVSELKKEILEKDSRVVSLKSKMPVSDSSKADREALELKDREIVLLQYKLKLSDNQKKELSDQLVSTKKNPSCNVAKQKMERAESEVDTLKNRSKDLEQAERLVRAAMEQISKRLEFLRNGVIKTVFVGCPGVTAPDDNEILSALIKFSDQLTDLQKCNKELTSRCEIENAVAEVARKLKEELKSTSSMLKDKDRVTHDLQSEIGRIGALQIADDALSGIRDAFVLHLQVTLEQEKKMENAIVQNESNSELHNRLQEAQTEITDLRLQLMRAEEHSTERIEREVNHRLVDIENKYREEIQRITYEGGLKLTQAVNETQKVSQETLENALKVEKQRSEETEQLVTHLRQNLKESENKFESMKTQAHDTVERLDASRRIETQLRTDLEQLKSMHAIEVERFAKSSQELNRRLEEVKKEREHLMERIESHASTLCTLEECLDMAVKKNKEYQIENGRLENTIAELENGQRETAIPPAPAPVIPQPVIDELAVGQLVRDNKELERMVSEQQNAITSLRRDLAGATARLSDVTAELSEAQKIAVEKGNRKILEQEKELVRLQNRITSMTKIMDKQADEVKELKENIRKEKELVAELREEISKQKTESNNLQKLAKEESERKAPEEFKENIRKELQNLGAQCRGECHLQTIERQREALAELRSRLKTLTGFSSEHQQPTTLEEALQQLIVLQKEFEILKANHPPPSAGVKEEKQSSPQSTDCAAVDRTRLIDFASKAQLDMEKSAHYETQKCLDYSEQSYLALVRAVSEVLDLDCESRLKSIAHLSLEESEHLTTERNSDQEKILDHVNSLKKRVERKDDLLEGYERNLSKVREAQDLAVYKNEKAESLLDEIRVLKEEIDCLQNALTRMREQLDREKRLNASIKQKKTFHLENGFSLKDGWPKHHCLREGIAKEKRSQDVEALELDDTKFRSTEGDGDFKLIAVDI